VVGGEIELVAGSHRSIIDETRDGEGSEKGGFSGTLTEVRPCCRLTRPRQTGYVASR
jgi:hypothetical protein